MRKYHFIKITLAMLIFFSSGCFKDLNTIPLDKDIITASAVFDDPSSYKSFLAKVYAGLAVSGQEGPSGDSDIKGLDEGFGQYTRGLFYLQELTTDEAVVGWNDQTILDFHGQDWDSEDGFIFAHYSRIFYQVVLCNEFLRETTNEKLNDRNVDAALQEEIQGYRAEARFLRALSYWHALDYFRNVPFITEKDKIGSFFPEQTNAADLFNYIESELKEIENEIAQVRTNEYGRADQGAVWMLLAKLYLNAEVYIGTKKYTECLNYCEKLLNAGYTLEPNYQNLFLADNNLSNEIIFPVCFDGNNTKTWGGTTFLIRAATGGSMDPAALGVASGWGGVRTTKEFVQKFPSDIGGKIVEPNEGQTAQYPKIYVPGAYQGWDPSKTANSLSSPTNNKIYEGHVYFPEDNSPFFITPYPSWSLKYGDNGADGTLETNGDTIRAGQAGLYYLKVDMNTKTYEMEKRSWSLNGAATGNQDIAMAWDADKQAMYVNANLSAGAFKFRANNDWTANLGDTGANSILEQDGDDIILEKGSSYDIWLYVDKPDYTYQINNTSYDTRGLFYTAGQSLEIDDITQFSNGYAVQKFKNIKSDGSPGSNSEFPDTDLPMFRLADVYLMAAEAILRNNGDKDKAVGYFNNVRERAYNGQGGNISADDLTLDMLIDERARELYWEGHRRTDLIRFGKFSDTDYKWAWKGGVKEGAAVESFRNVFPIPSADISANPNLQQNTGY